MVRRSIADMRVRDGAAPVAQTDGRGADQIRANLRKAYFSASLGSVAL